MEMRIYVIACTQSEAIRAAKAAHPKLKMIGKPIIAQPQTWQVDFFFGQNDVTEMRELLEAHKVTIDTRKKRKSKVIQAP